MPWKETDPMTERVQFIAAYVRPMYSMTGLCERFGIRRNTGDPWVRCYAKAGPVGLQEKRRAPHHCPQRIAEDDDPRAGCFLPQGLWPSGAPPSRRALYARGARCTIPLTKRGGA